MDFVHLGYGYEKYSSLSCFVPVVRINVIAACKNMLFSVWSMTITFTKCGKIVAKREAKLWKECKWITILRSCHSCRIFETVIINQAVIYLPSVACIALYGSNERPSVCAARNTSEFHLQIFTKQTGSGSCSLKVVCKHSVHALVACCFTWLPLRIHPLDGREQHSRTFQEENILFT